MLYTTPVNYELGSQPKFRAREAERVSFPFSFSLPYSRPFKLNVDSTTRIAITLVMQYVAIRVDVIVLSVIVFMIIMMMTVMICSVCLSGIPHQHYRSPAAPRLDGIVSVHATKRNDRAFIH